jgi:2-iminoacetate synthase ThiH
VNKCAFCAFYRDIESLMLHPVKEIFKDRETIARGDTRYDQGGVHPTSA